MRRRRARRRSRLGAVIAGGENWGQALEAVFGARVEDTLIQPTHVTGFPREISPLAKAHRNDPRLIERFETYVYGWEIANAFSELNDPQTSGSASRPRCGRATPATRRPSRWTRTT